MSGTTTNAPKMRSLADDLRNRDGDDLALLLRSRPDALDPIPSDISELAASLSDAASVRLAIDGLDAVHLAALRAVCAPGSGAVNDLATDIGGAAAVDAVLHSLWTSALIWGASASDDSAAIRPVTAVANLLGPQAVPAGEGQVERISAELPALERQEVSMPELVDGEGAAHALDAVTLVSQICELWSVEPVAGLRAGGIPARAVARVAEVIRADDVATGFWIEVAATANLVALDDFERPRIVPTLAYDTWRQSEPAHQWAQLTQAWLRDQRDVTELDRPNSNAAPMSDREVSLKTMDLRKLTLEALGSLSPGEACTAESLVEYLTFARPRIPSEQRTAIAQTTINEAELLGVIVRGGLSALGRALLESPSRPNDLAEAARQFLPPLVEQFVSQTDLTVVVPGPPTPALRQLLNACADLESTGGAFVYRFSGQSIQRAMRMAMSGSELLTELRDRSANDLPQPLEYLINDVDRSHHQVRIGHAESYLTADADFLDEVMGTEVANDVGLRRVSPTVIVANAASATIADLVRSMKREPLGDDGSAAQGFAGPHRSAGRTNEARIDADDTLISSLVTALKRTNETVDIADLPNVPAEFPRMPTAISSQVLQQAQKESIPVWVGYANNAGSTSRRLVDVIAMVGGAVSAFDHSTARITTLAVSRVTGAQLAEGVESRSGSGD